MSVHFLEDVPPESKKAVTAYRFSCLSRASDDALSLCRMPLRGCLARVGDLAVTTERVAENLGTMTCSD